MIGSTLAPCPLLDPFETTGDLRDDWDLPEDEYEHVHNGRARAAAYCQRNCAEGQARGGVRGSLALRLERMLVTLPKIDNGGSRS